MKRVKRLFACLLALTMILGLSATAFADQTTGKVQKPANGGTVTFEKEYKLVGEGISPAETFEFTIEKAGIENGGVDAEGQGTPSVGSVHYNQSTKDAPGEGATTVGNKKEVTVTLPTYNSVGVYSYTITETPGETAGVAYDRVPVTMKVTVIDNNGTLEIAAVSFTKDGKKLADGEAAFTNTYTANKLNITKTVKGNLGDKSKYFDFTVTLTGETGKTYTLPATITGGSNGSKKEESVTISGSTTFTLKHNDTITIENLPAGVRYKVEETPVDKYTTTSTGEVGTMDATAKTAAFTNTKTGEIDTGVYLDNLPYLLVFAGVLAIAAVFVVRRRRFED